MTHQQWSGHGDENKRAPVVPYLLKKHVRSRSPVHGRNYLQDGHDSKREKNHLGPRGKNAPEGKVNPGKTRPSPPQQRLPSYTQKSQRASSRPSVRSPCVHGPFETAMASVIGARGTARWGKNDLKWIGVWCKKPLSHDDLL